MLSDDCMQAEIAEDETIEDLQLKGLRLIQKKKAFRFGMDSVLLAHYARIRPNDTVADLGCGNGILPILLKGRNKGKLFFALEIMKDAAELAQRNMRLNGLEEDITVVHTDVSEAGKYIKSCSVDAVVCNPPYGHPEASLISPNAEKARARSQKAETLDSFLAAAFTMLKGRGKIFLIYPAPQMLFVMKKLQEHHLEPKRFQLVYPAWSKPANLVLVEAVKDARPTLHPLPPLIVYNEDGSLTKELKSVYHIQEQTGF